MIDNEIIKCNKNIIVSNITNLQYIYCQNGTFSDIISKFDALNLGTKY